MSSFGVDEEQSNRHFKIFLLAIIVFFISVMLFIEGSLKWVLGLFIISLMGGVIAYEIYERSGQISLWKRDNELDNIVNLNLERISGIADRAYHGREVSRALFEERIKKEFLKKVKNMKKISDSEMKKMMKNPESLRKVIDDDLITDFLLESKSYSEVIHDQSESKKPISEFLGLKKLSIDKDYKDKIDEVLKRMEEWN